MYIVSKIENNKDTRNKFGKVPYDLIQYAEQRNILKLILEFELKIIVMRHFGSSSFKIELKVVFYSICYWTKSN